MNVGSGKPLAIVALGKSLVTHLGLTLKENDLDFTRMAFVSSFVFSVKLEDKPPERFPPLGKKSQNHQIISSRRLKKDQLAIFCLCTLMSLGPQGMQLAGSACRPKVCFI